MAISEAQNKAISEAKAAVKTCAERARRCDLIGLGTLAREYDYFVRSFTEKIEMQLKALEGGESDGRKADLPEV